MPLGRLSIQDCIRSGAITALRLGAPLAPEDLVIGTNSVDVTLGREFARMSPVNCEIGIDPWDPASMRVERFAADTYTLRPGECLLGCTQESFAVMRGSITMHGQAVDIAPMYDGRSTCGRLFLASHITAGYGDVGFGAAWTLEIKNMSEHRLVLRAGMRIGQVSFEPVHGLVGEVYNGAYVDQDYTPRPPALGRERF